MHLKHIKHIIILAGCLFMLAACTNKPIDQNIKQQNNQGLELNKINANSPVDQQSANRAKHLLNKYEEIKSVRAVNLDKQLLVGVQLKHHDRFNKNDIEKKITKDINKHFTDLKITISNEEKKNIETKKNDHKSKHKNNIKKKIPKYINKKYPHLKIPLSNDEKIHLEIKKLEQALQERKLSKKELADKIKKIISLSKEKT